MKKFYKVTEFFKNYGFGLELESSNENDTEITQEEISKMNLKPLNSFDNGINSTIELVAVYDYEDEKEETNVIGYCQNWFGDIEIFKEEKALNELKKSKS